MNVDAAPYIVLHVVAGILAVGISASIWRRRHKPGGLALTVCIAAAALWCLGRAVGLMVEGTPAKITTAYFWSFGTLIVPFTFLTFGIQYSGLDHSRFWRWLARIAAATPIPLWLTFWINPGQLFWTGVYTDSSATFALYGLSYRAGFWMLIALVNLALLSTLVLLVRMVLINRGLYRKQAAVIIPAILVPLIVLGAYGAWHSPLRNLQVTAPSITFCVSLIGWALFGQRLLDIVPVALQVVIDGMTDAVIVIDAGSRISFLNQAAVTLIGGGGGWQGQPLSELFPGLDARLSRASADLAWTSTSGRRFDVAISPMMDRQEHDVGRVIVLRDVTSYRVLASTSARLIAAGQQQDILDAAFEALAGVLPETHPALLLLGPIEAGASAVVDVRGLSAAPAEIAVPAAAEGSSKMVEVALDRPGLALWRQSAEGARIGLLAVADELQTDARRPLVEALMALVAMRLEVNQEVVLRQREAEARAEDLAELNRLKDNLLDRVAHELRTPLSAIRAYSELLLTYDDPSVRREFVQIINNESERLTRLVTGVLDLTKLDSGTFTWHLTTVNVPALLSDAARIYRPLAEQAGLRLEVRCPAQLPAVWGDRDRLQEVLANLLHNALKFTVDGEIALEAQVAGEQVHISVSDSGIGILEQDRLRIFEKFEQVASTRANAPSQGTGLGLAICRELIRHQGGEIWVTGRPGGGSVFTFSLPLAGQEAAVAAPAS